MRVYNLSNETIQRWQWGDPLMRHLTDMVLALAQGLGGRALDVGAGTGRVAVALARRGFQVDALDPAADVVEQARALMTQLGANVTYHVADFTRVDPRFQENTFDLVVCSEVLEHVEAWRAMVDNMRRVLKPNGILILTVPNDPAQFSFLDTYAGHLRRFRWNDLASAFGGFKIEKSFTVGFPLTRTVHWLYTRILLPVVYREHRPDRMWQNGTMYRGIGSQVLYAAIRADDLFNGLRWGTTWVVKARKV
ncbi:MAG: class I SAM-dependent methyltransferase [Chloroflexi bacterium]|nr:class I SAM-dependent methyltransferase [Chloroflexota bacterium]